jgi:hypothetical protein
VEHIGPLQDTSDGKGTGGVAGFTCGGHRFATSPSLDVPDGIRQAAQDRVDHELRHALIMLHVSRNEFVPVKNGRGRDLEIGIGEWPPLLLEVRRDRGAGHTG